MDKIKVLFVDEDNGLRSPMAEAWLNYLGQGDFIASSAGFEAGQLSPLAVAAMREVGLDISGQPTRSVFDLYMRGELFTYAITLCDPASAEHCPIFPGVTRMTNWPFPNPAKENLSELEKMDRVREIRDRLKERIERFIQTNRPETQS